MSKIMELADDYAITLYKWMHTDSEETNVARAALAAEVEKLEMECHMINKVASDLSIGCSRLQGERDALRLELKCYSEHMERKLATTRNAALEESARVCDGMSKYQNPYDCADAIRALKEVKP